jgi:enoyl-CoA hydratase/carnithine racemase
MPAVYAYAREMAKNCSPSSLAIMKRQVYQDMAADLARANAEAQRLMIESFNRPDFKEGVDSFLEKRPPKFARL